jgi:hypothetical protein
MRRLSALVSVLVVVLLGFAALAQVARAQEATPVAGASLVGHPLVGAWILDTDTENDENPPTLAHFSSDGVYVDHGVFGEDGVGTWEATGPTTASLTFFSYFAEEGTFAGGTIVRAEIEVAADGQTLTATYTLEFADPTGASEGQYGPGMARGQRITVEPMGEPVGGLDELFEQFEEGTPTP